MRNHVFYSPARPRPGYAGSRAGGGILVQTFIRQFRCANCRLMASTSSRYPNMNKESSTTRKSQTRIEPRSRTKRPLRCQSLDSDHGVGMFQESVDRQHQQEWPRYLRLTRFLRFDIGGRIRKGSRKLCGLVRRCGYGSRRRVKLTHCTDRPGFPVVRPTALRVLPAHDSHKCEMRESGD